MNGRPKLGSAERWLSDRVWVIRCQQITKCADDDDLMWE